MRLIALAAALVGLAAFAGCGDDSNDGGTTSVIGGDNKGSLGPPTVLTFTYRASEGGKAEVARLTCTEGEGANASGYLESGDAVQFCKDVDSRRDLLVEGPDLTKACTTIYGGPETLRVSGRVDYDTVNQTFKRTNGCQIEAWEQMAPLLPADAPS